MSITKEQFLKIAMVSEINDYILDLEDDEYNEEIEHNFIDYVLGKRNHWYRKKWKLFNDSMEFTKNPHPKKEEEFIPKDDKDIFVDHLARLGYIITKEDLYIYGLQDQHKNTTRNLQTDSDTELEEEIDRLNLVF